MYANLSINETANRQAANKTSGSLVYTFNKLFIRHWDEYMLDPRHYPFVVPIEKGAGDVYKFASPPRDVLFGVDSDSPDNMMRQVKLLGRQTSIFLQLI